MCLSTLFPSASIYALFSFSNKIFIVHSLSLCLSLCLLSLSVRTTYKTPHQIPTALHLLATPTGTLLHIPAPATDTYCITHTSHPKRCHTYCTTPTRHMAPTTTCLPVALSVHLIHRFALDKLSLALPPPPPSTTKSSLSPPPLFLKNVALRAWGSRASAGMNTASRIAAIYQPLPPSFPPLNAR
jgi:hypothetical protein